MTHVAPGRPRGRCAILACARTRAPGKQLCAACLLAPVVMASRPGRETATLWLHPACASRVADSTGWRNNVFETLASLAAAGSTCAVCQGEIVEARGGRRAAAQERLW